MGKSGDKKRTYSGDEVKQYLGVLSEDFQGRVSAIGEQFSGLHKKIDSHTKMIGDIAVRMTGMESRLSAVELNTAITKEDVEFIKSHLKQKVDQEEFSALVRRVSLLERKSFGTKR
ncbi:MAG: hypothetical protein AAB819_03245 [Patescibacteria group bacterium]